MIKYLTSEVEYFPMIELHTNHIKDSLIGFYNEHRKIIFKHLDDSIENQIKEIYDKYSETMKTIEFVPQNEDELFESQKFISNFENLCKQIVAQVQLIFE